VILLQFLLLQEKERARVREKLERYTKEGLVSLVDVLDIHMSRTVKKVAFQLLFYSMYQLFRSFTHQ
jgi:hypothetical protein